MNSLISICIPTYNRPDFLKQTIASALAQSYRDIEIVVSDDSTNEDSKLLLEELQKKTPVPLRYLRNRHSKGQAGNVNTLFEAAHGDRLVLIHDDDLLLPNALQDLIQPWSNDPTLTASFGKQQLIAVDGTLLPDAEAFNARHYRMKENEGLRLSSLESALVQQFPNNGYLLLTDAARETGYRDEKALGTTRWSDYEFALRLAQNFSGFYYLDKYVAQYRLSEEAVSKQGFPTYMFPLIEKLDVPEASQWAQHKALERLAPVVIANYAAKGERREARRLYFSRYYPLRSRLSAAGLYRLLVATFPGLRKLLRG